MVVAFWRRALRAVAIQSAAGSSTPIRWAARVREAFSHLVRNDSRQPLRVRLEPWGREFVLHPHAELVFRVYGNPEPRELEAHWSGQELTLYGPTGSTIETFHGDREVGPGYEARPLG
jgi:hypothetical protein